ncbi:MAG: insulinase family protein [Spirochaetia bacterium]|nr:insulinase family protein [Spirochaetia bacterium]
MNLVRIILILLWLPFLSLIAEESVFEEVAKNLKDSIRKVRLENGLTLLMLRRTNSPTLALYTKFKVGSSDESPEIAGTAHLLEHMLFKGTTNVGTTDFEKEKKYYLLMKVTGNELDALRLQIRNLEDRGVAIPIDLKERKERLQRRLKSIEENQKKYIIKSEDTYIYEQHGQVGFNAYTSHDVTNYQIKLPSNRLEIWAKMESDRLSNPILREYYTERDVIMEERRMRIENRGFGILREKFLSLAFSKSPYQRPVIGYESNIPFLDIYETEDFFKTYYTPDNMVIGIVGDLDFQETETMIRKYFGGLKPSTKIRKEVRILESYNLGEKRIQFKYPGGSILMVGFNKPAFPHSDSTVFDLIDFILTKGVESRLYKSAVINEKISTQVSSWTSDPGERYSNLFTIFSYLNSDADPKRMEEIIWEEIEKIKNGDISDSEIQKAKNKNSADFLREVDSNSSLAEGLTYYETLTKNWEDMFKIYDKFNAVSKEDIKRVANKYFVKENMTIGHLDSRETK